MHDSTRYLDLPSQPALLRCYREFIEATSNAAVEHSVCGVCARNLNTREAQVIQLPLADLPNANLLVPQRSHPAHDLYSHCLLQPEGVTATDGGNEIVNICAECLKHLSSDVEGPPALSLANNMWIGCIPWELQVLTVPEQLLIALVHPRIYVFKWFLKNQDFHPDPASLQRGMRGNVSTYAQDIDGVTSMVEGRLLPQPLDILSSVITVTYIGKGQLPKPTLHSTFRVRRKVIRDALLWLKIHNSKYYGDISIDESRLALYPEDGVPMQIEDVIRHTTDTGLVDEENVGYVPDEDRNGKWHTRLISASPAYVANESQELK